MGFNLPSSQAIPEFHGMLHPYSIRKKPCQANTGIYGAKIHGKKEGNDHKGRTGSSGIPNGIPDSKGMDVPFSWEWGEHSWLSSARRREQHFVPIPVPDLGSSLHDCSGKHFPETPANPSAFHPLLLKKQPFPAMNASLRIQGTGKARILWETHPGVKY